MIVGCVGSVGLPSSAQPTGFSEELEQEIGGFDAQFLLDFFAVEIGAYFYNRGLYDAQAILEKRLESITEAIYDLEMPTEFR